MKHGKKVNGKIEYAKEFDLSTLPNNNVAIIETNLTNVTYTRPPKRLSYKYRK